MMTKYLAFTILLLTIVISKPSFALGKLGHQIVCQLAFEKLPEGKQKKINSLLKTIPKEHQSLINRYNYHKKGSTISFDAACTWADAIKRLEEYKSFNAWHYMNVARSHHEIKLNECTKNCLPQAILVHQKALASPQKPLSWQQTQALLFIGHWLGDIHQPLHISFKDDLGGNKIEFSHSQTKCSNLHWYWDDCILYKGKKSKSTWLSLLKNNWSNHTQPLWQPNQVWQWANESFQTVIQPNFNYCQINEQGNCQKPQGKIKLPYDYLKLHQPVMEIQLLRAAQRLTNVLNASL